MSTIHRASLHLPAEAHHRVCIVILDVRPAHGLTCGHPVFQPQVVRQAYWQRSSFEGILGGHQRAINGKPTLPI